MSTPRQRKYQREYARRWRKKHPARAKAAQRRYDERHPELKAMRNRANHDLNNIGKKLDNTYADGVRF